RHTRSKRDWSSDVCSSDLFVATGYRKWGMTNGTNAALLIRDLILREQSEFAALFSPSRKTKMDPALKKYFSFNAEVAKQLVKGRSEERRVGKECRSRRHRG